MRQRAREIYHDYHHFDELLTHECDGMRTFLCKIISEYVLKLLKISQLSFFEIKYYFWMRATFQKKRRKTEIKYISMKISYMIWLLANNNNFILSHLLCHLYSSMMREREEVEREFDNVENFYHIKKKTSWYLALCNNRYFYKIHDILDNFL